MTPDEQIAIPILIEQEFKKLLRAYLAKIKMELEEKVEILSGDYDSAVWAVRQTDIEEVFAQYEKDQ